MTEDSKRSCVECKHYNESQFFVDRCSRKECMKWCNVNGWLMGPCSEMRAKADKCGHDGRYWERACWIMRLLEFRL